MNLKPNVAIATICSNNYFAKALTMAESTLGCDVYILIVDRPDKRIDYEGNSSATVLFAHKLDIPYLSHNAGRYNLIELNTSVKPHLLRYLIRHEAKYDFVYYLDPDTCLYSDISPITSHLQSSLCVLTPHILRPLPLDTLIPSDRTFLQYGIFNLGFFGINPKHPKAIDLLEWWELRCSEQCFVDIKKGLFVDQLWMSMVPSIFPDVSILRHWGCNVGPWNFHERFLSTADGSNFYVNGRDRLIFFHFSGYRSREVPCVDPYNRVVISDRPDLEWLYEQYSTRVLANGDAHYSSIAPRPEWLARCSMSDGLLD